MTVKRTEHGGRFIGRRNLAKTLSAIRRAADVSTSVCSNIDEKQYGCHGTATLIGPPISLLSFLRVLCRPALGDYYHDSFLPSQAPTLPLPLSHSFSHGNHGQSRQSRSSRCASTSLFAFRHPFSLTALFASYILSPTPPSRTRSPSRTLCSRSCMREQNPR